MEVRSIYRTLLRTVRKFPTEKILELSEDPIPFSKAASAQIRREFKAAKAAEPSAAAKAFATAQKELKALTLLLGNEHLKRYPGPPAVAKLHES